MKVAQLCLILCDPMNYTVHGILQTRILEWVAFPFSREASQPRYRTQVSGIAGRFFTSWATGKPKNTRVGSLSLLQGIFPTQELNRGLLHCRQILYQLSYQESPDIHYSSIYHYSLLIIYPLLIYQPLTSGSVLKNLPGKQEMQVRFLGQEEALENEMATHCHSSILA